MIRAAGWFCNEHHGVIAPAQKSWCSANADVAKIVDRPVKNLGRMTADARGGLCAAAIALAAARWEKPDEIGLICAGFDGCIAADVEYFSDYVASGRSLGRGNLFIYTLPTSAAGEIAIALSLTGPCMCLQNESRPLAALVQHAQQLLNESDHMLALWSDSRAAICLAIEAGTTDETVFSAGLLAQPSPAEMATEFHRIVQRT